MTSVPESSLLALVNAAGARFERVVFTRNRRVIVSVGDRGRTLRLHDSFRDAPADLLSAIATMYGRAPAVQRTAARAAIRDLIESRRPEIAAVPPATRRRRTPVADRPHIERLVAEFERVNGEHFDGVLPALPIALSGRMRRRNGHFSSLPLEIVVSRRLCTDAAPGEAEQTLRHEMIHLWQHVVGSKPGHGADFRSWARRLGVHPRATRVVRLSVAGGPE